MRRGRLILLVGAVVLAGCAKEEAASDPETAQLVADGAVMVPADLGDGWTVQPNDPVIEALQACSLPEALGVPLGAAQSDVVRSTDQTTAVGAVHLWATAGQANAALGVVVTDEFALCARTVFADAIAASGGQLVDRRTAIDPAPQRADGTVRARVIFVTQRSDGTRLELATDVLRIRRGAATITSVSAGPSRSDDATDVQAALDAMLNRVAAG